MQVLLGAAAADPNMEVGRLPMMDEAERLNVLQASAGAVDDAEHSCLHELFTEQARAQPHAPCVSCAGAVLTYAEARALAPACQEQLATHIKPCCALSGV